MIKHLKSTIWISGLALLGFYFALLQARDVEKLEGQVHEAFLTPVAETVVFQAINNQPPESIKEAIPPQENSKAIWIPGYWSWSAERSDFIWISGVWRLPPPQS